MVDLLLVDFMYIVYVNLHLVKQILEHSKYFISAGFELEENCITSVVNWSRMFQWTSIVLNLCVSIPPASVKYNEVIKQMLNNMTIS